MLELLFVAIEMIIQFSCKKDFNTLFRLNSSLWKLSYEILIVVNTGCSKIRFEMKLQKAPKFYNFIFFSITIMG